LLDQHDVTHAFKRLLPAAKLPGHFSPHSLRHTSASLLLQAGVSPVYVQRQLGHASIQLTVDTYGKWLPLGKKGAVDQLDDAATGHARAVRSVTARRPSGSKTVAARPRRVREARLTAECEKGGI
jgi:integrase